MRHNQSLHDKEIPSAKHPDDQTCSELLTSLQRIKKVSESQSIWSKTKAVSLSVCQKPR